MPIITGQGIFTEELCENSKKYISHLLIGKTGIKSHFLNWDLFSTEKFNSHISAQIISKQEIIDNLIEIETLHAQDYLKAYDPEVKKQQADLRSKKLAWVSIAVIIGLATAFTVPFTLGLLGSLATLVGVVCLASAVSLTCCSIIPAFFGETLIDDEWIKEYEIEKEKSQKKIAAIITTSETEVINQGIVKKNSHSLIIQQTPQIDLTKKSTTPSLISVATENIQQIIGFIYNSSFFKRSKKDETIHLQSLTTSANKSC